MENQPHSPDLATYRQRRHQSLRHYGLILFLTLLGVGALATNGPGFGQTTEYPKPNQEVDQKATRDYSDHIGFEWAHDPVAALTCPRIRDGFLNAKYSCGVTYIPYEFDASEFYTAEDSIRSAFGNNVGDWAKALAIAKNDLGWHLRNDKAHCDTYFGPDTGCGYMKVGAANSGNLHLFMMCANSPTCGNHRQQTNGFEGTQTQIPEHLYGGIMPTNDATFWVRVKRSIVVGPDKASYNYRMGFRWEISYHMNCARTNNSICQGLTYLDWTGHLNNHTEIGFGDNIPHIETRKGHLDQLLVTWAEPVRYKLDQYNLIQTDSSGQPTNQRINPDQRINQGGTVENKIDWIYNIEHTTNPSNWPTNTGTTEGGTESIGWNDRVNIDFNTRQYSTPIGYYQPVQDCGTSPHCSNELQWFNGGAILLYKPETEVYFRIKVKQYHHNQEYNHYSTPHSYIFPQAYTTTETYYTKQNEPGIRLTWNNTYQGTISHYEYRIGYQEGCDQQFNQPTGCEELQYQTTWATGNNWVQACDNDLTKTGNTHTIEIQSLHPNTDGCGTDPNIPIPNNLNYRIQVRAVDTTRTGQFKTQNVRNYTNPELIEVNLNFDPPQPLTNIQHATTNNAITISYSPPQIGPPLTKVEYRIKQTTQPDNQYTQWQTLPSPQATNITITGLQPGTTYNIQIRISNPTGIADPQTTQATTGTNTGTTPTTPQPTQPPATNPPNTTPPATNPPATTPTTPQPTQPPATTTPNTQPPASNPPTPNPPTNTGNVNVDVTGNNNTVIVGDNNSTTFTDTTGNVHQTNIVQLADMGVTRGCNPPENSRFCPNRAVTRAEMATFLVRSFDLATTSEDPFTDTTGNVHGSNINRMAAAGISRGCNPPQNSRFCPDRAVTRGEMATFMTRVLELEEEGSGFTDTKDNIHATNISRFANAGITRGCNPREGNTRYCPDRAVTRAEMATFLVRSTALNNS